MLSLFRSPLAATVWRGVLATRHELPHHIGVTRTPLLVVLLSTRRPGKPNVDAKRPQKFTPPQPQAAAKRKVTDATIVSEPTRPIANGEESMRVEVVRGPQGLELKDPLQLDLSNSSPEEISATITELDVAGVELAAHGTPEALTEAIISLQKSLVIKRNVRKDEMPEIYDSLVLLASLHTKRGEERDKELAADAFGEVRRIGEEFGDYEPNPVAANLPDLAATLEQAMKAAVAPKNGGVAAGLTAAAFMRISRQDPVQQKHGVTLYKQAIDAEKSQHGEESHGAAEISALLGTMYVMLGNHSEAKRIHDSLQELVKRHPEPAFNKTRVALKVLANDLEAPATMQDED